jgi:hypothetical protein
MREALFVKQNSAKWKDYEQLQTNNPDEMANRFIDITNDLAYAKTFYPTSKKRRLVDLLLFGSRSFPAFFIPTGDNCYMRSFFS